MSDITAVSLKLLSTPELINLDTVPEIYNVSQYNSTDDDIHVYKYKVSEPYIDSMLYKIIVDKVKVICSTCGGYIRRASSLTPTNTPISIRLRAILPNYCICTGKDYGISYSSTHFTLMYIYNNNLQQIFDLPDKDVVFRKYVVILDKATCIKLPHGPELCKYYNKLMKGRDKLSYKDRDAKGNFKTERDIIYAIFSVINNVIKGKEGLFRSIVIPRRLTNTARIVIVPDVYIDTDMMAIPDYILAYLGPYVVVSEKNIYTILSMIENHQIAIIQHDKTIYHISNKPISIVVYTIQDDDIFSIPIDMITGLLYRDKWISKPVEISLVYHMLRVGSVKTVMVNNIKYDIHNKVFCSLVAYDRDLSKVRNITYDIGLKVRAILDGTKTINHRNPVMCDTIKSSGIYRYKSRSTVDNSSDVRYNSKVLNSSITKSDVLVIHKNLENIQPGRNYRKVLEIVDVPSRDNTKGLIRYFNDITDDIKQGNDVTNYPKMRSIPARVTEKNLAMGVPPFVTGIYGGDFDGDEMNICPGVDITDDNMYILKCLPSGSIGILQDYKYGLYRLINDGHNWYKMDRNIQTESTTYRLPDLDVIQYYPYIDLEVWMFVSYLLFEQTDILEQAVKNSTIFNHAMISFYHSITAAFTMGGFIRRVCTFLAALTDHHGLSYDYKNEANAADIVRSKAKPTDAVYGAIYRDIGYVKIQLGGGKEACSYIKSNYLQGVDKLDYRELCFSHKESLAKKGADTPFEGDNMRQLSYFMSGIVIKDNISYYKDRPICINITPDYRQFLMEKNCISQFDGKYDMFLNLSGPKLPYSNRTKHLLEAKYRTNHLKYGQRKLLLTEIYFLATHTKPDFRYLVIYAGAASGSHISILRKMFPNVSLYLYDTNTFSKALYGKFGKTKFRVKIFAEKFTTEVAAKMRDYYNKKLENHKNYNRDTNTIGIDEKSEKHKKKRNKPNRVTYYNKPWGGLLFISDIRNSIGKEPTNTEIKVDNDLNINLVEILKPDSYMLKFRCPFEEGNTKFYDGKLLLQPWSDRYSAETRLIAEGLPKIKTYDNIEYEQLMYHHNIVRCLPRDEHLPIIMKKFFSSVVTPYYDMYQEYHILKSYVEYLGIKSDIDYEISKYFRTINLDMYGTTDMLKHKDTQIDNI